MYPPTTSRLANEHITGNGGKVSHSQKILNALKKIKEGNFEKIAYYASMKESQVWKRLSELEKAGLIEKTTKTSILSSGDVGTVWRIAQQQNIIVQQKTLF
jgi:predicted transcriptional regulator